MLNLFSLQVPFVYSTSFRSDINLKKIKKEQIKVKGKDIPVTGHGGP
jgi:hypothetical protein